MLDNNLSSPNANAAGPAQTGETPAIPWRARVQVLAVWAITLALMTGLLVIRLPVTGQVVLRVGDVAPRDIVAPRQVTYISEILTEQRRALAANSVPDVYDPPQARIGRQQLTLAGQILDFINSVRADGYADRVLKASYLQAITRLNLSAQTVDRILTLPDESWERVAAEVQVVLERTMREEIRETNLTDERRKILARVRLDFSDEDAAVVNDIVQDLLVPNSFYNAERTAQRREAARDAVQPITTTLERNEIILRAGDIVTELDLEALRALGLQQTGWSWREILNTAALTLLLGGILLYYLWRQEPELWSDLRAVILLASVLLVFVASARAVVVGRTLIPYLFPYAALTIILTITLNLRISLLVTFLFVMLIGWLTGGNLELMAYVLAASLMGTLKLRRGERLANYAWTALYIIVTNLAVITVFRVTAGRWDMQAAAELAAASLINGVISIAVTILGLYLSGALFGIVTPLQLLELSRPTHPLLRQLLLKAPGTYHHTLIVSNMAERAAEAIGANALLTRVGAYYHDVGKTIRPYFFVENRSEGMDPHARLDPLTSAQIIITHVKDGMDLARKYRLPRRIIDFIPEHQGTAPVSYFYHMAKQQASSPDAVNPAQFRYPGPRPRSKETAITMLADGAEATVRSRRPTSIEELERIVAESIQARLLSGELDDSPLTMADLAAIRRAFVDVLRGLHHPRIAYPGDVKPAEVTPQPVVQMLPVESPKTGANELAISIEPHQSQQNQISF